MDQARIDPLRVLIGEAEPIERAGTKVPNSRLRLEETQEDFSAAIRFQIKRIRLLIACLDQERSAHPLFVH